MANQVHSLERFLKQRYVWIAIVNVLLVAWVVYLAELDLLEGLTVCLLSFVPVSYWCLQAYRETTDVLERVGLQLDALGNEEFNTWHLAKFERGRVQSLKSDAQRLATKMQNARDAFAQQEAVLMFVIEQLSIPVVILDAHKRVYSANKGFAELVSRPSENIAGRYAEEFSLEKVANSWRFEPDSVLGSKYRVFENQLSRGQLRLDIVLCFSVERTLRENEKRVWQRLLRVLNHEVRNSLTPISSIAQSLQQMSMTDENREKSVTLLQVIEQRALHLLSFVEAYSAFNRIQPPNQKAIQAKALAKSLIALYPQIRVTVKGEGVLFADEGQLQQALINVIKNAVEASPAADSVEVIIDMQADTRVIRVLDSGNGIENPDNLFVPFYSTKSGGSGIGLVLSRELLRQQGGDLTVHSRPDEKGAEAVMTLPKSDFV